MQKFLAVACQSLNVQRNRATYYHQRNRFIPVALRRFFLRYPRAHLYITLGILCCAMLSPLVPSFYYFFKLSPAEFDEYVKARRALVRERQRYGTNLWIPFYSAGEPSKETQSNE
ncbi:hypothetical protein DICVIV_07653 [Dictyocaulus viviparus]|uniref:Uncharacterized protein n=1 Tax=Dictyocaulus viviparus TaxID=29172 RepID=A0A0D8XV83_DICVI|nr:hypothetical protein DICVIV_07653 [Dictyocaulus viviparus]